MLTRAVGNASVAMVSESTVDRFFPGLLVKAHEIRWSDTRQPVWLANLCDMPGLLWYAVYERKLRERNVAQVWVLQHDTGWTGQLPATLSLFSSSHDLLCEGLGKNDNQWVHVTEVNHQVEEDHLYGCLLPVTRYSVRLLGDQMRALRAGNVSYCEMRAATQCASAPWPCSSADLRGHGVLGAFSFYTAIAEEQLINKTGRPQWVLPADFVVGANKIAQPRELHETPSGAGKVGAGGVGAGRVGAGRVLAEPEAPPELGASLEEPLGSGRALSESRRKAHALKLKHAAPAADTRLTGPAADTWRNVEPFSSKLLHQAHGAFLKVVEAARSEQCRAAPGETASVYGRLYHRVFEPGLQRGRYADCPMMCPPDWSGFAEIEIAKKTGCVFNCIFNPANFSDPAGKAKQAELEKELLATHQKKMAAAAGGVAPQPKQSRAEHRKGAAPH